MFVNHFLWVTFSWVQWNKHISYTVIDFACFCHHFVCEALVKCVCRIVAINMRTSLIWMSLQVEYFQKTHQSHVHCELTNENIQRLNVCALLVGVHLTHSHSEFLYRVSSATIILLKGNFAKYLNESCFVASDELFFLKCFPRYAFVGKNISKIVRLVLATLSVNGLNQFRFF